MCTQFKLDNINNVLIKRRSISYYVLHFFQSLHSYFVLEKKLKEKFPSTVIIHHRSILLCIPGQKMHIPSYCRSQNGFSNKMNVILKVNLHVISIFHATAIL